MSNLTSSAFIADSVERAVKTFAQTIVALLGAGAVNIVTVDWGQILSVAAGAAVVSLLTSVASSGVGDNSASLVNKK